MTTKPVEVKSSNQIVQNKKMVILVLIVWIAYTIYLGLEGLKAWTLRMFLCFPASWLPSLLTIRLFLTIGQGGIDY